MGQTEQQRQLKVLERCDAASRQVRNEKNAAALSAIQQLMSGEEWSPDTLDDIAEIIEQAGFPVDYKEKSRQPAAGENQ